MGATLLPDHLHSSSITQVCILSEQTGNQQKSRITVEGGFILVFFSSRRSEMVALQNFLCAGCGTEVEPSKYCTAKMTLTSGLKAQLS